MRSGKNIIKQVRERELTDKELKRREEIAKDLPDADFKKRYGDAWMGVKMATATKMAKKESNELEEGTYQFKLKSEFKNAPIKDIEADMKDFGIKDAQVKSTGSGRIQVKSKENMTAVSTAVSHIVESNKLEEEYVFTVRFEKEGTRFASPFHSQKNANDGAKILKKSSGVTDVSITKDVLKPGVKFSEGKIIQEELNELEEDVKSQYGPDGAIQVLYLLYQGLDRPQRGSDTPEKDFKIPQAKVTSQGRSGLELIVKLTQRKQFKGKIAVPYGYGTTAPFSVPKKTLLDPIWSTTHGLHLSATKETHIEFQNELKKQMSGIKLYKSNNKTIGYDYKKYYPNWLPIKAILDRTHSTKGTDKDKYIRDEVEIEEENKLIEASAQAITDVIKKEDKHDKKVKKGYHIMPDGTMMKDSEHKKESKDLEEKLNDNVDETLDKIREINIQKSKSMRNVIADIYKVKEEKELKETEKDIYVEAAVLAIGAAARALGEKPIDPADLDNFASDDDRKAADKNIIIQLRRAQDMGGKADVTFLDNPRKKIKIDIKIINKALEMFDKMRPNDKARMQSTISKSYKGLLDTVKRGRV